MKKLIILIIILNYTNHIFNSMVQEAARPIAETIPVAIRGSLYKPYRPTQSSVRRSYPTSAPYRSPFTVKAPEYSIFTRKSLPQIKPLGLEQLRYYSTKATEEKPTPFSKFDNVKENMKFINMSSSVGGGPIKIENILYYDPNTKIIADNLKKQLEGIYNKSLGIYSYRTLYPQDYIALINNLFFLFGPQELPEIPEKRWWWQSKGYTDSWNPELEKKYKIKRYRPIDSAGATSVLELVGKEMLDKIQKLLNNFARDPIQAYGRENSRIGNLETFLIENNILKESKLFFPIFSFIEDANFSWDTFKRELNPELKTHLEFINLFDAMYKEHLLFELFKKANTYWAEVKQYEAPRPGQETPRTEKAEIPKETRTIYKESPKTLHEAHQRAIDYETGKINAYELLGLPVSADQNTLKNRYRMLALKFHPDAVAKNPQDQKMATTILKQLNQIKDDYKF